MGMLSVRKLADKSEGTRIRMYDEMTGDAKLVNPDTPGTDHEPWPLAGVQVEGECPDACRVPMSFVQKGKQEGWIELEGETVQFRPGGPADDPWRVTHTFLQAEKVVLKTVDGDVRFHVTANPDKHGQAGDPDAEVRWFFDLEREA